MEQAVEIRLRQRFVVQLLVPRVVQLHLEAEADYAALERLLLPMMLLAAYGRRVRVLSACCL